MKKKLRRCTNCLMPETRPRISYDKRGVCNACQWAEEKRTDVDWEARWKELEAFCDKYRSQNENFDCIVPASGGKDSSYVAYMMKHKLGMHPLCVNVVPPLTFDVGVQNLKNFIEVGFDCVMINPNPLVAKEISKKALIEHGQPLLSWIINVQVAIFKTAINFNVPFVMFGEEGETEYGGSSKLKNSAVYEIDDSIALYLSGIGPEQFETEFSEKELYWWKYPSEDEFRNSALAIAHWSYFENWDPYKHYLLTKEKFGMKGKATNSVGTYNDFSQNDTCLYDLHTYLMYLKFGFGRCTQDVGIDIRRGTMDRKQAVELVKQLDGAYPDPYVEQYLEFFDLSREEFEAVLDKWANKDLLEKVNGRWRPIFEIE